MLERTIMQEIIEELEYTLSKLKAENEALRKDAERYLWICKQDFEDGGHIEPFEGYKTMRDNRIDAARGVK